MWNSAMSRLCSLSVITITVLLFPDFAYSGEVPLTWGAKITNGNKLIDIPAVATAGDHIACLAVLPPTENAPSGTLICRLGGQWNSKRNGPASNPQRNDADCVLFINLDTGTFYRHAGLQPAPNYAVVSDNGRYFALASSTGWAPTAESFSMTVRLHTDFPKNRSSGLTVDELSSKLKDSLTGTTLYTIWETASLRPIWEMRYADNTSTNEFFKPSEDAWRVRLPWWAFDEEPRLYRYPLMAFSPEGRYFVASNHYDGMVILDTLTGYQRIAVQATETTYPIAFTFTEKSKAEVMISDGKIRIIRLADEHMNGETEGRTVFSTLPVACQTHNDTVTLYPLFCSNCSHQLVATLDKSDLRILTLYPAERTLGPFSLHKVPSESPIGVSRLEIAHSGRWAGIQIVQSRETIENLRFQNNCITRRFERIDMKNFIVVQRVTNLAELKVGADTVQQTFVDKGRVFSACLSWNGEDIIWAIPVQTPEALFVPRGKR